MTPSGVLRFADGAHPGLTGYLRIAGAKALTTFYRRMVFMTYELRGVNIPVYNGHIDLEFRTLARADIDAYMSCRPDASRALMEKRFAAGNRCFAALHAGRIVDVCWSATQSVYVQYLDHDVALHDGDIYSFDSYTVPEYRGRGVYMARNSWQARLNQAEGFNRSVALVAYENYAAWLILSRSGLKSRGTYHYLRVPGARTGIHWQTS